MEKQLTLEQLEALSQPAGESTRLTRQWVIFGLVAGLLGDAAFFAASIAGAINPEPMFVDFLLGAAVGPGISLGFVGLYHFVKHHRNSALLQAATLFGIIAGVLINAMLVVQTALALGFEQGVKDALGPAWEAVWMVQSALDVSWDIFFTLATIFLGLAMWRHPRLGPIFGAITILIGGSLLAFNLATFPSPPAAAGLVDLGPLSGAWFAILSLRALTSLRWMENAS